MNEEIIIGRKWIMDFFGIRTWRTVQNWKTRGRIGILRHMPNGKPFMLRSEAISFLTIYDNLRRREKGGK